MEGIQIISTTAIQAASHSTNLNQKIELGPWDLQLLLVEAIQKGLLFQNPISKDSKHTLIQHLKQSLSLTLSFFPVLAGRLAIVEHGDETASVSVVCSNAGVEFVHAIAGNTTCSHILQTIYVPHIVHSFFPQNGVKGYEGASKPLLAVQVTELVDGIFISCSINHSVADGASFWHFFNSWAEISRGAEKLSKSPSFIYWFPDGVEPPIRIPFAKEMKTAKGFNSEVPKKRVFHFKKEKIAELKEKANAEANTHRISSLQALLTHLWISVVRNQHLEPEEEVNYKLPIGARHRIRNPPLPENYFGNAVVAGGVVTMKTRELVEGGIGNAALEMNKMIASHTEEKIKSYYESWHKNPKLLGGNALPANTMITSSSPWFDIYGNDFGWGKPVAARSGATKKNGKFTVFAGAEEGSIDIELCLSEETLEAMGNDSEFMDAVST